jgi:hypothetical protein
MHVSQCTIQYKENIAKKITIKGGAVSPCTKLKIFTPGKNICLSMHWMPLKVVIIFNSGICRSSI